MDKKAQTISEGVKALLVVIVIAVVALIFIFPYFLGEKAVAKNVFKDIVKGLGIDIKAEDRYTELAERVAKIKGSSDVSAVIAEIDSEIRNLPENEQSLLNRYTQLKFEAAANGQAQDVNNEFLNDKKYQYDGGEISAFQANLDEIKGRFQKVVTDYPNTAASELAQGNVNLIENIYNCDKKAIDNALCEPEKSHNFCIQWTDSSSSKRCGFANCDKAKVSIDYCRAIEQKLKICVFTNDCKSCTSITNCAGYDNAEGAVCVNNLCGVPGRCIRKSYGCISGCDFQNEADCKSHAGNWCDWINNKCISKAPDKLPTP